MHTRKNKIVLLVKPSQHEPTAPMEPFKNLLNASLVQQAGSHLKRVHPPFDAAAFTRQAQQGLDALEMKARALHICAALQATLPARFDDAAAVIEAALAPAEAGENLGNLQGIDAGLRGWILWPVGEYVAQSGLQHPQRALQVLHAITQRFTAEWAIRPFIVQHPALVFDTLAGWCQDPSPHVRRLVSEGSRPRLPWGLRLHPLVQDPRPTLPLLRALQDDPSDYVRRSVANHLNDIAKDHPAVLVQWLQEHLPAAPEARQALLRHACRTLVKSGHPQVLQAWGLGTPFKGHAVLQVSPTQVQLGAGVVLQLVLQSSGRHAQELLVDYVVHHVKASGSTSAKVFKGWKLRLPAGATVQLAKRHAIKPITTRTYRAGWHAVQVQVNGRVAAASGFELRF